MLAIIGLCGIAALLALWSARPRWMTWRSIDGQLALELPADLQADQPAALDANVAEVLWAGAQDAPALRVSVRRESRLGMLQLGGGGSIRERLLDQLDRRYPVQYPGFHKLARSQQFVGGDQLDLIEFTYDSPATPTKIYQWLGLVVRNTDAYFIAVQCPLNEVALVRPLARHMLQSVRVE